MEGLQFGLDLCQEKIIVETDSSELVQMIKSSVRDRSPLGHLVQDLRLLLSTDRIVSVIKIPRTCNVASHELARFGLLNQRTQFWLGSVPDELLDRIRKDCNISISI